MTTYTEGTDGDEGDSEHVVNDPVVHAEDPRLVAGEGIELLVLPDVVDLVDELDFLLLD